MSSKGGAVRKTKVFGQKIEQKRIQTTGGSREKYRLVLLNINNEKENTINIWNKA